MALDLHNMVENGDGSHGKTPKKNTNKNKSKWHAHSFHVWYIYSTYIYHILPLKNNQM